MQCANTLNNQFIKRLKVTIEHLLPHKEFSFRLEFHHHDFTLPERGGLLGI